ncbi:DUF922 domain-containing protein [Vicingaceae bacterium]|nr:DUF922 domain-containing protein [Vicingaceae bacterium]MDC1450998.1 DUF922 domain-containing protein [Vicingaceae bacterium]
MKQFTLVIFILTVMSFSEAEEKKLIEYHKRNELNWEDYQARPNHQSSFKALTATKITFKANSKGKTLRFSIKNTFEPHNSWTKGNESVLLLEHERLHFHISELYARKLRKEIQETKFTTTDQKLMNEISRIYEYKMNELSKYQIRYDRETSHSTVEQKQKEWESKIKAELLSFKHFSNPNVEIQI